MNERNYSNAGRHRVKRLFAVICKLANTALPRITIEIAYFTRGCSFGFYQMFHYDHRNSLQILQPPIRMKSHRLLHWTGCRCHSWQRCVPWRVWAWYTLWQYSSSMSFIAKTSRCNSWLQHSRALPLRMESHIRLKFLLLFI